MTINYHITGNPPNSVVVNFDGEVYPVAREDFRFVDILNAIFEDRLSDIPDIIKRVEKQFTGVGIEFKDNEVYVDGESIPEEISNRIIQFKEQNLPTEYLVKFASKLKKNPSYHTRQALFQFLEHNGHPITKDGNFIAYKGVSKDFKDLHTRKIDNSVGATPSMPRSAVNDDPTELCSAGLHVACHAYAKQYYGGEMMIEVEVDPVDVVCVPKEYNNTKMRVCRYKVMNVCERIREEALYDWDGCNYEDEYDFYDEEDINWLL